MHFDDPQTPANQTAFSAEPLERGWFARNWLWFIPLVILLPILICAGCCTGMFTFGIGVLKTSEPYTKALAAVQEDPRVQEALGTPIEDATWIPTGEIDATNNQGEARLDFDVKGPKGPGHVHTKSRMIDGAWQMFELTVTIGETGERIVLELPGNDEVEDAPLWEP
jgi:hypothetical protein